MGPDEAVRDRSRTPSSCTGNCGAAKSIAESRDQRSHRPRHARRLEPAAPGLPAALAGAARAVAVGPGVPRLRGGALARAAGRRWRDGVRPAPRAQGRPAADPRPSRLRRPGAGAAPRRLVGAVRVPRADVLLRLDRRARHVRHDRQAVRRAGRTRPRGGHGGVRAGLRRGDGDAGEARRQPAVPRAAAAAPRLLLSDEQAARRDSRTGTARRSTTAPR